MQLNFFAKLTGRVAAAFTSAPSGKRTPLSIESADLQKSARSLVRSLGSSSLAARLQVVWNPRMRSSAGMAFPSKALITLNPRLLPFGAEEVDRTLRHELAHLLAHDRAGRRRIAAHGPEWQKACIDLGLQDEKRCHDLPLPRREMQRRYMYRCPGCGTEVHRVRPLRHKSACLACCRAYSRGSYDERFKFVKLPK